MSTSGHALNSSPLSFVAMTMLLSVLSIGPLQGVGADIYQIEGKVKNIILFNTGDNVEHRDWFRLAVSNSLWRIDMKPIKWTELGQEVTPVGEYAVSATWDGKQFVYDIESKPSPRQFVVGDNPFPFGVGDSSLYIIWYGLASGAYMEASGGKKLPPARMAKMEDNAGTENTVAGRCVIHPEPPRLPLRVTLPLLKREMNPQSRAVFLTNCVIQSSFPAICGTLCIPSQVRAEYFVYEMGLLEKVRRSGEVVVTVAIDRRVYG